MLRIQLDLNLELPEPFFKVHIGLYCFKACQQNSIEGFCMSISVSAKICI